MSTATDVLLIGGGVIGMMLARELADAGRSVRLVERGRCGEEASWAGGGIVSPLYPWRYPDAVSRLASWSQDAYPDYIARLEADCGRSVEYARHGLLLLRIFDADEALDWAQRYGRRLERLAPEEACALQAGLAVDAPALWMPGVASVRNPRLLAALRSWCQQSARVLLHEQEEVVALATAGDGAVVDTGAGRYHADQVVVCAGAWSAELLARCGVQLAVEPVLGQMLLYAARPGLLSRIILHDGRYLIPRADGRILAGSTREHTGFDKRLSEQACRELQSAAQAMLPALAEIPLEAQWCGLRPGSPTGVPTMSAVPQMPGFHICSGHFRNGLVLAPASARFMADLLLGRTPIVDPAAYSLSASASPS